VDDTSPMSLAKASSRLCSTLGLLTFGVGVDDNVGWQKGGDGHDLVGASVNRNAGDKSVQKITIGYDGEHSCFYQSLGSLTSLDNANEE
jgi:hypothetical protein